MQERVIDHALQIYGGYGFTEEYPAGRMHRDSRVNKIVEGTNEINRLLMTRWILRKDAAENSELASAVIEMTGNAREIAAGDSNPWQIWRCLWPTVKNSLSTAFVRPSRNMGIAFPTSRR